MEFLDYYIEKNIEKINPINFIYNQFINFKISDLKDKILLKNPQLFLTLDINLLKEEADKYWDTHYKNLVEMEIPKSFVTLFSDNDKSKRQQEKLLRGESISVLQMQALMIKVWKEFNFTYSYYHFEVLSDRIKKEDLPTIFQAENKKITKIGNTKLSDGELNNIIEQRNARVVNFFDNGNVWHCFFITYRSISGKESWNDEKPHYHYFSNKWWNIKREDILKQFETIKYPSTKVHINISDY